MGDFKTNLIKTRQILQLAEPKIKSMLGFSEGSIIDVEDINNDVCKHLDAMCGIDYLFYFKNETWTRGVGWRAQPIKSNHSVYNTFTIRKERDNGTTTEYEKRKAAIENNAIYPYYTIHAYYAEDTGRLLSMAIAKTKDIIECIEKGLCSVIHTGEEQIGQASAYTIKWSDMRNNGYKILEAYNFN